jgi:hypothetical protein
MVTGALGPLTEQSANHICALLFPGRLTVRLQTLTLSIEVRILTGEPFIAFKLLKYSPYIDLIRRLANIRSHIWMSFIFGFGGKYVETSPREATPTNITLVIGTGTFPSLGK